MAKKQKKIILRNHQCPGDLVMLAYAIKALHEQYPGEFLTGVETSCAEIFEGNPYVTKLNKSDKDVLVINIGYDTIHKSNQYPYHFANSFLHDLSATLGMPIEPTMWSGAIFITDQEQHWFSAVYEKLGKDVPYWVVDAGYKKDYTAKAWDATRYQEVVSRFPEITFVQMGLENEHHVHPKLKGDNVINLINKTDTRQLIRLIYNSFGVLTPVSLPMVLAYAVPPHPRFGRKSRAAVIVAGGQGKETTGSKDQLNSISTPAGCWIAATSEGAGSRGSSRSATATPRTKVSVCARCN